jgi:hypothetical protein
MELTRRDLLKGAAALGAAGAVPATLADGAQAAFKRNMFIGFGPDVAKSIPQAERQQFLGANVIVNAEPSPAR